MMPWSDPSLNTHQRALRERVRALARVRGENPVLARGRRVTASADQDTWVYTMTGCEGSGDLVVAINRADESRGVTIPAGSYTDLLTDTAWTGGAATLGARSFVVLAPVP
jgi:hypothetical protein